MFSIGFELRVPEVGLFPLHDFQFAYILQRIRRRSGELIDLEKLREDMAYFDFLRLWLSSFCVIRTTYTHIVYSYCETYALSIEYPLSYEESGFRKNPIATDYTGKAWKEVEEVQN